MINTGTDIYICMERKYTDPSGRTSWISVDRFKYNKYHESEDDRLTVDWIYKDRNYELFGLLANVRYQTTPIADPRGLPDDISIETKKEYKSMENYAYAEHYYLVSELFDYYRMHKDVKRHGYVSPDEAFMISGGYEPEFWCESREEYNYHKSEDDDSEGVYVEWVARYSPLEELILPIQKRICEEENVSYGENSKEMCAMLGDVAQNYRVVFWFD